MEGVPEKLLVAPLFKKFLTFFRTRKFITVFMKAYHLPQY
jgi:hypothetical protein